MNMVKREASRKKCGHYCAGHGDERCCRCTNPANGEHWLPWRFVCHVCKGVLFKHPDGFYVQRCPRCGATVMTLDRDGTPVSAPLAGCPNCITIDEVPEGARKKMSPRLRSRLERNATMKKGIVK